MHMQSAHGCGTESRNRSDKLCQPQRSPERTGAGPRKVCCRRAGPAESGPEATDPPRPVPDQDRPRRPEPARAAATREGAESAIADLRFEDEIRHVSIWRFDKIRHDSDVASVAPCTFIPKSPHEHQHSLQVTPVLGPKSGAASSRARRPPVPRARSPDREGGRDDAVVGREAERWEDHILNVAALT